MTWSSDSIAGNPLVMGNPLTHAMAPAWLVDGRDAAVQAVDAYSDDQSLKLIINAKRAGWDVDGGPIEEKGRKAVDARAAGPARPPRSSG